MLSAKGICPMRALTTIGLYTIWIDKSKKVSVVTFVYDEECT